MQQFTQYLSTYRKQTVRTILYITLITVLIACKSKTRESRINLEIPKVKKQSKDSLKRIKIRIDDKGSYYINNNHIVFDSIIKKINSLEKFEFNTSNIMIHADKKVRVSNIIKIMELIQNNGKKVTLGKSLN